MKLTLALTAWWLGAVLMAKGSASQSYSFGIGFDSADAFRGTPFFESSRRPSAPTGVPSTSSVSSSRSSTSRISSSGRAASNPAPSRSSSSSSRNPGSFSSFSFSGLDDEAPTPTPTAAPAQRVAPQTGRRAPPRPRGQSSRTPSAPVSQQQNEVEPSSGVTIGQSPCARGAIGQSCREHLRTTAMSCTSGKCHQCQNCGSIGADAWVGCCRDHFLCCRPLARACQRCDQPLLLPFCNAAFGKCQ